MNAIAGWIVETICVVSADARADFVDRSPARGRIDGFTRTYQSADVVFHAQSPMAVVS